MSVFFILILLLASFSAGAQCNQDIVTGMVARWDCNGNAIDSSGNGHNGLLSFAPATTNRCSAAQSALSFFGSGQYFTVPDASDLRLGSSDFTISAWVLKWDTVANPNYSIVAKRVFSGQQGYHYYLDANTLRQAFAVSGNADPVAFASTPVSTGSWHNLAITYTRADSTVRFYLDGLPDGKKGSMPPPNQLSTSVLRVGNDTWLSGTYGFNGIIDDIRIFSRALDSCSIESLITDDNPCSLTSTLKFKKQPGFSINSQTGMAWFATNEVVEISVFAVGGNLVMTAAGSTICISTLPPGVYWLQATAAGGTKYPVQRFIK